MEGKVTSKDIAKIAGVSQATVSYILNNKKGKKISEETRSKVLKITKDLNYIPNNAAQRLRKKSTKCIVVRIATNITMRRYHLMLQGMRTVMGENGYSLLLGGLSQGPLYPDYITACLSGQADGIIYVSSDNIDIPLDEIKVVKENNIPIAAVDCMRNVDDISSISYDYFSSSFNRVEAFLEKGFKRILYIRPDYENRKEDWREKGVSAALAGSDCDLKTIHIHSIDGNSSTLNPSEMANMNIIDKNIRLQLKDLTYSQPADSAYICSSLEVSEIVARYLYERWLVSPSSFTKPWYECLISYHFDHYSIGCEAARMLLDLLAGKKRITKLTQQPILDFYSEDSF